MRGILLNRRGVRLAAAVVLVATLTVSHRERYEGPRDYLVGWYAWERGEGEGFLGWLAKAARAIVNRRHVPNWARPKVERLVPVMKRGGAYYTVVNWFEAPLVPCEAGLECSPGTSLAGTTIGYDREKREYYIIHKDSYAASVSDTYEYGKRSRLRRVGAPRMPFDAEAAPPAAGDDMCGWYAFYWALPLAFEVYEEGGKIFGAEHVLQADGAWGARQSIAEVAALSGERGVALRADDRRSKAALTWNRAARRYEVGPLGDSADAPGGCIPLVRFDSPPPVDANLLKPLYPIGIPAWH